MSLFLTLAMAAGIIALFVGIERALGTQSDRLDRRLLRYGARRLSPVEQAAAEMGQESAGPGVVTRTVERAIQGRTFTQNLQADLNRAGVPMTAAEFVALQAGIALIPGVIVSLLVPVAFGQPPNPLGFLVCGFIGFYFPKMWVKNREAARGKAFNNQLADTITLMANSMRSGMSLLQAMEMISREAEEPTRTEFSRVVREIGLGVSPDDALLHLVRRIKSDDLDLMVTAMMVQHEVGGNLSKILDTIAHTIRERVKLKGQIRAITGQQRATGYMLGALPLFLGGIMLLIAPKYISSLWTPPGPWTLVPFGGLVSTFIGFAVIQKITDIEI